MNKEMIKKLKEHKANMTAIMDDFIDMGKKIKASECTLYVPIVENRTIEIIPLTLEEASDKLPRTYPKESKYTLEQSEVEHIAKYSIHTMIEKSSERGNTLENTLSEIIQEVAAGLKKNGEEDEDGSLAQEIATGVLFENVMTQLSDSLIPFEYEMHQDIHRMMYYLHMALTGDVANNCIVLQDGLEGILFFNNISEDLADDRWNSDNIIFSYLYETGNTSRGINMPLLKDLTKNGYRSAGVTATQSSAGDIALKIIISKAANAFDNYPDETYNLASAKVYTLAGYRNIMLVLSAIAMGCSKFPSHIEEYIKKDRAPICIPEIASALVAKAREDNVNLAEEMTRLLVTRLQEDTNNKYELIHDKGISSRLKIILD